MLKELLEALFQSNNLEFSCIDLLSSDSSSQVKIPKPFQLECALLACENDFVMALYPASHRFNLPRLNKSVCKDLHLLTKNEHETLSQKISNGNVPNLNVEQGLHVFIDEALDSQGKVYILNDEMHQAYVVELEQLHNLSSDKLIGISFSEEMEKLKEGKKSTMDFKERVKALHSLPPMPETASQILMLRAKPDVKVEQIVAVIEKDPLLVAQIVSYANSAFFGQAGSVKSLKDAIFRVLGVDAVMNMALALSIGTTFKIPKSGPIGAKAIWQSSVYSAALMQRITMLMPWGQRPNPGTAYLVGLLHDIGLLVLGHLFPEEYQELNHYLGENSEEKIVTAEEHVLGITHTEVGKMVMRLWNMPDELIAVTTNHHKINYHGEHEEYIQLLVIVESLLTPHGLAHGDYAQELPAHLLEKLSLDEEEVIIAADEVLQEGEIIKTLAQQMCA